MLIVLYFHHWRMGVLRRQWERDIQHEATMEDHQEIMATREDHEVVDTVKLVG